MNPLQIATPSQIADHAFNARLLVTPREAEVLLEYCGYLHFKLYKKGDHLYRSTLQHDGRDDLRVTSLSEVVLYCIRLCDALIEAERNQDYPSVDYITRIIDDKQHLAAIWERLTGLLEYDIQY